MDGRVPPIPYQFEIESYTMRSGPASILCISTLAVGSCAILALSSHEPSAGDVTDRAALSREHTAAVATADSVSRKAVLGGRQPGR